MALPTGSAPAPGHAVLAAVAGLGQVLDTVEGAPVWSLGPAEVAGALADLQAVAARVAELQLRLVRAAGTSDLPAQTGAPRVQDWLIDALRIAPGQARAQVLLAEAVTGEMAPTGAALATGQISLEHAQVIRRALDELDSEVPAATRARVQQHLLEQAGVFDPVALARLARRVLEVVDPEAAEAALARQLAAQERREGTCRLRTADDGHGTTWLRGRFPSWMYAQVRAALDPLAAPRPTTEEGPDPRPPDQRQGEALVELARRALADQTVGTRGGDPVTLVVTLGLDDLRAAAAHAGGLGLLDTGEVVPPHALRRWACQAGIIPAVLDGPGHVLDLGRTRRLFTGAVRRALELRDGGCAFPGCHRPPAWCEGHHIVSWVLGGTTDPTNGVLLCGRHHDLVHRGDWTVRLGADGLPEFIPPAWVDPHRRPRRNKRLRR